jgi:hypothetical protein
MVLEEFRRHWADLLVKSFEIIPPPQGIDHNQFHAIDFTDTALKLRNTTNQVERYLEFNLIDTIGLGKL